MNITYDTKRVDDRRNKHYSRVVRVFVYGDQEELAGVQESVLADVMRPILAGHAKVRGGSLYEPGARGVIVTFSASKPSQIFDEETAVNAVKACEDHVRDSIAEQQQAWAAVKLAERDAEQATRLAAWIGENAAQKAQEVTRYNQRLAALDAELAAETKVQLDAFLAGDKVETGAAQATADFSERAIATARVHASRYAGSTPRGFPGSGRAGLKVEDLVEPAVACRDCGHPQHEHSADAGCTRCSCSRCRASIEEPREKT